MLGGGALRTAIVAGGLPIGHVLLVHEPAPSAMFCSTNAAHYRKDRCSAACCRRG